MAEAIAPSPPSYAYHQTHVPTTFKKCRRVPKYLRQDQPKSSRTKTIPLPPDYFRLNAVELLELLANNTTVPLKKRRGKRRKRRGKKKPQPVQHKLPPPPPKLPSNQLLYPNHPTNSTSSTKTRTSGTCSTARKVKAWTSLTVSTEENRRQKSHVAPTSPISKRNSPPTAPDVTVKTHRDLLNGRPKKEGYSHSHRTHARVDEKIEKARREAQPWMFKTMVNNVTRLGSARRPTQTKRVVVASGAAKQWKDFAKGSTVSQGISTGTERQATTGTTTATAIATASANVVVPKLNLQQQTTATRPPGRKQHRDFVRHNKVMSARASSEHQRGVLTQRSQRRQEVYARAAKRREKERARAEAVAQQREQRRALRVRGDEHLARTTAWMKLVKLASRTQMLATAWKKEQNNQSALVIQKSAASVILGAWARKTAPKRGEEFRGAYGTVQKACLKLIMRRRMGMKRRAAGRIMNFVLGIASQRFRGVMLQFRNCVIKAQRYWRSFRRCKHARILALNYIWDEVELELRIIEKRNRTHRLRKMLKTLSETSPWLNAAVRRERVGFRRQQAKQKERSMAAADIAGTVIEGERIDGVQFVVGDRAAALLDRHLRDGLTMIMKRNEIKARLLEPVPFDIRFEVLHVLLTELRKKHAVDMSAIKQQFGKEHVNITREEIQLAHGSPNKDTQTVQSNGNVAGTSSSIEGRLKLPPFIVYSTLGESSLLTIVNTGRQMFEKRKEEGYKTKFNITPLYTPEEVPIELLDSEDDVIAELAQQQLFERRAAAAKKRKKINILAKTRTEKLKKEQERTRTMKKQTTQVQKASAVVVSVPSTWLSKRR